MGASGSPKFVGAVVGGSILVGAIVQAARESQAYNACMEPWVLSWTMRRTGRATLRDLLTAAPRAP